MRETPTARSSGSGALLVVGVLLLVLLFAGGGLALFVTRRAAPTTTVPTATSPATTSIACRRRFAAGHDREVCGLYGLGDTTCDSCIAESCCEPGARARPTPRKAFDDCLRTCNDHDGNCLGPCTEKHHAGKPKHDALGACVRNSACFCLGTRGTLTDSGQRRIQRSRRSRASRAAATRFDWTTTASGNACNPGDTYTFVCPPVRKPAPIAGLGVYAKDPRYATQPNTRASSTQRRAAPFACAWRFRSPFTPARPAMASGPTRNSAAACAFSFP